MTEEEVIIQMDSEPKHIRDMILRRAVRMIYQAEVDWDDEEAFNNWRISKGLPPLDENNLRP